MPFEPPTSPFSQYSPYGYPYPTPPPPPNMPHRGYSFHEFNGAGTVPTPAPSPRTPQHSRRRSHDYNNAEFGAGIRRPQTGVPHEHQDFSHEFATPPRPHTRAGPPHLHAQYHTPINTPPPTSHGHHTGVPPHFYNTYAHAGFAPGSTDYFHTFPGSPTSPPPRDRTRSARSQRRESTWTSGEHSPRSPPRPTPRRAKTTGQTESTPVWDSEFLRQQASAHGIGADYSLKNWDPNERPIILLGSVFDANSLGEWIFNWTKYHHGRYSAATDVAGRLWEMLIELGFKLKRAIEFSPTILKTESKEIVSDFLVSGERLWTKLKALLKTCEEYMWNGVKASDKGVSMGKKSGAEFVEAMFSAEKEWEKTEKLMRGVQTWCKRFEVNCEEILRNPDA